MSRRFASRCPGWGLAALLASAGIARQAGADELRLSLSYRAPAECPSAEALQRAVRRLATAETKPYSASVVIEHRAEQFSARITSADGAERLLAGDTCEEVIEATAVILALAISPNSPAPIAPRETARAAAPAVSSEPPNSGRSIRFKLGAASVLDLGTMPQLDLGLAGRVGATAHRWSAALEGSYWLLPQSQTLSQDSTVGGKFSWWTLAAVGCVAPKDGRFRVELCAGPELGHLVGRGFGLDGAHEASAFRFGFQAMGDAQAALSAHFRVRAGLGVAAVVFGRHEFYIDGRELYRPQLFAGRAVLGADFIF